jgi:dipeptidyl aminopeptidase/acylaminoacyl peptidase
LLKYSIKNDQVSIVQPEFSPDGQHLAFLSNKTGWWQILLYQIESNNLEKITKFEADHCLPPWIQNQMFFAFSPDSQQIYCIRNSRGFATLWKVNTDTKKEKQIDLPAAYTWLEAIAVSPKLGRIALVATGGRTPPEIVVINSNEEIQVIRSNTGRIDSDTCSQPEALSLQDQQADKLHGLFYKPQNPAFRSTGKPPLLIIIHSGPTRQKYAEFQPRTQFFTSRGYAVLEVNYRGSTGYGRDYWEILKGQWGILDVKDVYEAANALSRSGLIDNQRIGLLGSSSGGLTVLQLLVNYPEFFRAGISLYGITNLNELTKDPPKFERFYHDWLVGDPLTEADEYHSRSPLYAADMIRTPIVIFQGAKDPIVPRDQAEQIVEALKKNGVQHEYHLYPDEGHGFKKSENVRDFYQKTESFLKRYLLGN